MADDTTTTTDATGGNEEGTTQADNQNTEAQQNQSDAQSAEGSTQDTKDSGDAKPEDMTYEKFKVPEGMTFNEDLNNAFTPIAKDLGLNQEQAQKLVDMYSTWQKTQADAQTNDSVALHKEWGERLAADTEVGGPDLDKNLGFAGRVLDKFGTDEVRAVFNESGIGNHPAMVKMFIQIGKSLSEDTLDSGESQVLAKSQKSHAETLYPNHPKSQY